MVGLSGQSHIVLHQSPQQRARARPLSTRASGDGLWELSDGTHPPVPFYLDSIPGLPCSILGQSSDATEPWSDREEDCPEQYSDALVRHLAKLLKTQCSKNGAKTFDLMVDAPSTWIHTVPDDESSLNLNQNDFQNTPSLPQLGEPFETAWERCFAPTNGPATRHPVWRLGQGEKLLNLSLTAREATTLGNKDIDPNFKYDSNHWGQEASNCITLWLIKAEGYEPFLFLRHDSTSSHTHSDCDEVDTSTSLGAKGAFYWGESVNMSASWRAEPNVFSELCCKLPEVKPIGFDFTLGYPVEIHLDPVFESDAKKWLDLIQKPWIDQEVYLQHVWARIHAQQLVLECSSKEHLKAAPLNVLRPRL